MPWWSEDLEVKLHYRLLSLVDPLDEPVVAPHGQDQSSPYVIFQVKSRKMVISVFWGISLKSDGNFVLRNR